MVCWTFFSFPRMSERLVERVVLQVANASSRKVFYFGTSGRYSVIMHTPHTLSDASEHLALHPHTIFQNKGASPVYQKIYNKMESETRPQKRRKLLLSEENSEIESSQVEEEFTVNEDFARRFEHNKKREELHRCKSSHYGLPT